MKKPVRVALKMIRFRTSDTDHTNSCLPILPLYNSWEAEQRSHIAYSILDTAETRSKKDLKIWVHLEKSTPDEYVQVRARFMPPSPVDFVAERLAKMHAGNEALGTVAPTLIPFDQTGNSVYRGTSNYVPMVLQDLDFEEHGPGVYDINWRWEFRGSSGLTEEGDIKWNKLWKPVGITKHRVYLVSGTPGFPWSPDHTKSFDFKIPHAEPLWVRALYVSCLWAKGSKSLNQAIAQICTKLFECGRFRYQPGPAYTDIINSSEIRRSRDWPEFKADKEIYRFNLTKFLDRILGENGLGEGINCLDCSMAVMALSNILGGRLRVGKLQNTASMDYEKSDIIEENEFEINQIKAIGLESVEVTMRGLATNDSHYFSYHSIAWEAKDETAFPSPKDFNIECVIHDAVLQFATGSEGNYNFELPTGMVLGAEDSERTYRAKLAANTKNGRPRCKPQPETVLPVQIV